MNYVITKGEEGGQPNAYVCLRGGRGLRGRANGMIVWKKMLNNLDGNFLQAIFLWEKLMEFMLFIEISKKKIFQNAIQ